MIASEIATTDELAVWEKEDRKQVENERKFAWDA